MWRSWRGGTGTHVRSGDQHRVARLGSASRSSTTSASSPASTSPLLLDWRSTSQLRALAGGGVTTMSWTCSANGSGCAKAGPRHRRRRSAIPSRSRPPRPCGGPAGGYDAAKKINGRKRHIAVDTIGLLICVLVTAASVQDRDGAGPLLTKLAAACGVSAWSGPTADTPASSWTGSKRPCTCVSRSSDVAATRPGSSCPGAGSSNAPWPGSPGTAAAPATTRPCPLTTKPWSAGP